MHWNDCESYTMHFPFLDLLSVFQQNLKKTMVIRKIMQVP